MVHLCLELKISCSKLTPDVQNWPEFDSCGQCSNIFQRVPQIQKALGDQQSFVKKELKVSVAVSAAERFLLELKNSLVEHSNIKVTATNLAIQL